MIDATKISTTPLGDTSDPSRDTTGDPTANAAAAVNGEARRVNHHRKNCACKKCRETRNAGGIVDRPPLVAPQASNAAPVIFDRNMIEDLAGQVCELADDYLTRRVYAAALKASNGSNSTASTLASDCQMTSLERDKIKKLSGVIAEKYKVAGVQYAPEILLAVIVGGWFYRGYRVTGQIAKMITVPAAAPKPVPITPAPAAPIAPELKPV